MKRLLIAFAASVLATSPALAEESHEHSAPAQGKQGGMHEHMKTMEQSMAKMQGCSMMNGAKEH